MSAKSDEPNAPAAVEQGPVDNQGKPKSQSGRRQTTAQLHLEYSSWQAPIPPPSAFRDYDEIIPNGAERIFSQFENETKHRHKMEARSQYFPLVDQLAARICALLFAFACLVVVGYAIQQKAEWVAAILGGAMIVAGINAFIRRQSNESNRKAAED